MTDQDAPQTGEAVAEQEAAGARQRAWLTSVGRVALMLVTIALGFGYVLTVRSNHLLSDAARRAASPRLNDFGSWHRIRVFSGSGPGDIPNFSVQHSPWSISYITQPVGDGPMRFQVLIYNSHGGFVEVAADRDQAARGLAHLTGIGDYRLRVNGNALWSIGVEEYR